jgi:hypothetical protein
MYILFILSYFSPLLLSICSKSSTLSFGPESLSYTWSNLLVRLLAGLLNLTYWAFHFQNFSLIFFWNFYFFIKFLFYILHCLHYFTQLFICVLWICSVFKFVVFHLIDYFYNHSFEFLGLSSTSLLIVELLTFGGVVLPCVFMFFVFLD